jgi:hypothetical protein
VIHARNVISPTSSMVTLKEMFLMGVIEKVLESLVIHSVVLQHGAAIIHGVILQGAVVHGVILHEGHMIQGAVVGHPGWAVDSSVVLGASSIHHRGLVAATNIGHHFSKGYLDQQDQNKGNKARRHGVVVVVVVVWNGYLEFVSKLIPRLRKDCSYLGSAVSCYYDGSSKFILATPYILSDGPRGERSTTVISVVSKLRFLSMWNGLLYAPDSSKSSLKTQTTAF